MWFDSLQYIGIYAMAYYSMLYTVLYSIQCTVHSILYCTVLYCELYANILYNIQYLYVGKSKSFRTNWFLKITEKDNIMFLRMFLKVTSVPINVFLQSFIPLLKNRTVLKSWDKYTHSFSLGIFFKYFTWDNGPTESKRQNLWPDFLWFSFHWCQGTLKSFYRRHSLQSLIIQ